MSDYKLICSAHIEDLEIYFAKIDLHVNKFMCISEMCGQWLY